MSRILIIEDDRTINGLLRSVLEKSGYTVDSADNGAEGLALGRQGSYSLILLDLMLPEKPGGETGYADSGRACQRAGPQEYIRTADAFAEAE